MLDFGKYKGVTLRSVRTTDPAYVRWMATKVCLIPTVAILAHAPAFRPRTPSPTDAPLVFCPQAFCRGKPALKAGLVACGVLDADGVVPVTRVASGAPAAASSTGCGAASSGNAGTSAEAMHAMLVRLKTGPLAALVDALDADIESLKVT